MKQVLVQMIGALAGADFSYGPKEKVSMPESEALALEKQGCLKIISASDFSEEDKEQLAASMFAKDRKIFDLEAQVQATMEDSAKKDQIIETTDTIFKEQKKEFVETKKRLQLREQSIEQDKIALATAKNEVEQTRKKISSVELALKQATEEVTALKKDVKAYEDSKLAGEANVATSAKKSKAGDQTAAKTNKQGR